VSTTVGSVSLGRISLNSRSAQSHEDLAFRTELDDNASFLVFSGKVLEVAGARGARVGHPHIALSIDMDAMRPYEHLAAKAPDLFPGIIEQVDRVCFCAEAAWGRAGRASVSRPHGLAVAVDGHAVGTAPGSFLQTQSCPIPDDTIRIGAAVHGLHLVRLNGAAPLLRLNGGAWQSDPDDNPESRNT